MATKIWVGTDSGNEGDWDTAANWSPSGVPGSATVDDIYFENSSQSVTAGFDQTAMGNMSSLNIDQSYTGSIGTDSVALQIETPTLNIGYHNGPGTPAGSPLINIDLGTDATAITVTNTGTSADTSRAPVRLKGSSGDNDLTLYKGKVAFGTDTDDTTSQLRNVTVSYATQVATDADLFIGSLGAVVDLIDIWGGDVYLEIGATEVNIKNGSLYTTGAGTLATLNVNGGTVTSNSTGTIANLNIFDGSGVVDFTKSNAPRTVTTAKLDPGGRLSFDSSVVTLTNKVQAYTSARNVTYTAS